MSSSDCDENNGDGDPICRDATNNSTDTNEIDENAMAQFKLIIVIVLGILLLFLGFFIYNLIKCYLPKWTGKRKLQEEGIPAKIQNSKEINTNGGGVSIEL